MATTERTISFIRDNAREAMRHFNTVGGLKVSFEVQDTERGFRVYGHDAVAVGTVVRPHYLVVDIKPIKAGEVSVEVYRVGVNNTYLIAESVCSPVLAHFVIMGAIFKTYGDL